MTQYHVFEDALRQAQQTADKAHAELETVRGKRDRYARFNPDKIENEIANAEAMILRMERDIAARTVVHGDLETDIRRLESKIRALFNPRNWFDREQHRLRQEREKHRARQRCLIKANSTASREIRSLSSKRAALGHLAHEYAEATAQDLDQVVRKAEQAHAHSLASLSNVLARKAAFDSKAAPLLEQIEDYEAEIDKLEQRIDIAQDYDEALSEAENAYERAQIHEACEDHLGYSSPRKAIRALNDKLDALQRNLNKSRHQLDLHATRSLREIHHLVIDGSNLCYEDSREHSFVGLAPLQALLPKLITDYKVTLVFDANIRSLLKLNDEAIRKKLPRKVRTHITANGAKADPILLRIADSNGHTYVISNDRFSDFPDSAAARNRVLRHEIVAGRVIIDDLDVDVPYE